MPVVNKSEMPKYLLFITALLLAQLGYSQPNKKLTKKEIETERNNHNCARNSDLSLQERLRKYPFNVAAQVRLISFEGEGVINIKGNEFIFSPSDPGLLTDGETEASKVQYLKASEIKNLTPVQIDTLTDILYNYGFAGPVRTGRTMECYSPHHAVLFLDNTGKAVAFIEICFQCSETRESSGNISMGERCAQKFDMLKAFFKTAGIEQGFTEPAHGK